MWYWHVHHDVLIEHSDNIEERISYIKEFKPRSEIELRLHLLKEATGVTQDLAASLDHLGFNGTESKQNIELLTQLHSEQCDPRCPWIPISHYDKSTIRSVLYGNMLTEINGLTRKYELKPEIIDG